MKRELKLVPIVFFAIAFLFSDSVVSQISWQKLFVKKSSDVFRSVVEVPPGGYIVAGYTANFSQTDTDAFIVRLNIYGDTLWTKTYDLGGKNMIYKVPFLMMVYYH